MALLSSPPTHFPTLSPNSPSKTHLTLKPYLLIRPKRHLNLVSIRAIDNGSGIVASVTTVEDEKKVPEASVTESESNSESSDGSLESNGYPAAGGSTAESLVAKYENPKWVGGTWDLKQFQKDGATDWDAVIDAEVKRRKWLEDNPPDNPVVFDTSIIPWWA